MLIEKPTEEEKMLIGKNLEAYNLHVVPALVPAKWHSCSFVARDEDGQVIGGILARLGYWAGLEIAAVWIAEPYRRSGIGTQLLARAEEEAVSKGGKIALTDTFDFHAVDFYLRNGYRIFGELADFPPGHKRYYLEKRLSSFDE